MSPPINLDGDTVDAITMDGTDVSEVTVDGDTVFSAIPDSGLLYDFNADSLSLNDNDTVSSWTDDESGASLSATGDPTYRTNQINGKPVVETDGSDDGFTSSITDSQPIVWYFVIDEISQSVDFARIASDGDGDWYIQARPNSNEMAYQFGGTDPILGGTYETGEQLLTIESDDANNASRLRRNASDIVTGDGAGSGYANLGFAFRQSGNDEYWAGQFARILGYDKSQMNSGQITDVESALNDIYSLY